MKYLILCLFSLSVTATLAQKKIKIGKLSESIFKTDISKYEDESAVFLKKERFTECRLSDWEEGWYIISQYHNVVRIQSTKGFNYGTVTVNLYKSSGNEERIDDIVGYTYEMVNGTLVKTKLDKGSIFKRTLNDRWDEVSFALPQVKQGAILEYTYRVESPFWKIDDLIFQENIPVLSYNAEIKVPEVFKFNTYYQGKHRCNFDSEIKTESFNFAYSKSGSYGTKSHKTNAATMKLAQAIYKFQKNDIPALKEEAFTNNLENYRSSIIFELASTELTKGDKKNYTTSWEKVAQTLNNSDQFGKPLLKTNFLQEEAKRFRESDLNQKERAHNIYDYVKQNMAWDGDYRSRIDRSLKKAYESKSGASAEVNMLLIALLREAGLKADPVLTATKSYKMPIFPTLEGFNHIIAAVVLNDKRILLDATQQYAKPGQLSQNVRNWEGRLIRSDGSSEKINLFVTKHVQEQIMINATVTDDGEIMGEMRQRLLGENEISFRKKFKPLSPQEQKALITQNLKLENVSDFELESSFDKYAEVSLKFESSDEVEEIGGKWYVAPLLFLTKTENPFVKENRETPIDFNYPSIERKIINITVPENYALQSQPAPVKLVMDGNLGEYSLNISQQGAIIQISSILQINRPLFPPSDYETIRSFYSQMLEKQKEKIVLIKQ